MREEAQMSEPETYSLGETIRVPVKLKDEDGVSRVYADFRKLRDASVGPGKLDPNGKIVLQGDGGGRTEATVGLTGRVTDDFTPGNYLCVAIHVYDATGHLQTIENPSPSKVLRIVKEAEGVERPTEFLGWG
jgi:hypothetical protein